MSLFENSQTPERVMLISVDTGEFDAGESIDELELLVETAGGEAVLKMIQKMPSANPATYVGSGRIQDLKEAVKNNQIDLIVADDELSPAQLKNIEDITEARVIDRTMLILDIFALRARSREGKLQVELAQLKYSLPFLTGKGKGLSRLGGGIGTRGPGESKLESDRRHIRRRIQSLENELADIAKRREQLRRRREKDGVETVAIIGYTNAGKSTLMNTLTEAGVLAENKLFATLDPTSRALTLPDGREIMLIDTVGLIRRLPHHLVEAFKSTLEEAANATAILNVCDASDPHCGEHLQVTFDLLSSLGCQNKPIISVMNKCDKAENLYALPNIGRFCMISALTGEGIPQLLATIQLSLPPTRKKAEFLIPYDKGAVASKIREDGVIISEEYRPDGIYIKAVVNMIFIEKNKDYLFK